MLAGAARRLLLLFLLLFFNCYCHADMDTKYAYTVVYRGHDIQEHIQMLNSASAPPSLGISTAFYRMRKEVKFFTVL